MAGGKQHPTMTAINCRRIIAICILLFGMGESLKDVRVFVPSAIKRGENAVLVCHYDLEDDSLYQLKWYKGGNEFYRYTPKEDPPIKIFKIANLSLTVLQNACNATHVTLSKVSPALSGRYLCEVSVDAPSFHTAMKSGDMDIVEIPKEVPTISGLRQRYRIGDILIGNCTSSFSKPAANLTWMINGEQAPSNLIVVYPIRKEKGTDRENSQIGLSLPITSHLFKGGRLKVRCSASIHTLYWKSTEKSVDEDKPKSTHNLQPVPPSTDQPLTGFKYADDDMNEVQADIKAISGGSSDYFNNCPFVLVLVTSSTLLFSVR